MFLLCMLYTLGGVFHKKLKKESGVIIVHSGLKKSLFLIILERDHWKPIN